MGNALEAGARVGPYEIVGLLAAGGMGEVYRARDTRLKRDVAVKVVRDPPGDPHQLERFEQEARAAAALSHRNILAIYDVGVHEGRGFLVSELLEGATLRRRLEAGPLPPATAIGFARQVAIGLAAAHAKGIVHRDIKPENIFLTADEGVKILDFGLAKIVSTEWVEAARTDTAPAAIPGTLGYISPEQIQGGSVDARSDIFSLGAVLYEMVAGKRAFSGPSATATLAAILTADPPPLPIDSSRSTAAGIGVIVRQCLEKAPGQRFQSAADLALALEAVATPGDRVWPGRFGRTRGSTPRPRRGTRRLLLAALTTALALASGTALFLDRTATGWLRTDAGAAGARRRFVAVLPFKSLAPDGQQDYFAAGITEEIHNQLAKISALRLLGRTAARRYANRELREIAGDLGTGSVVEGTVRVDAGRVRVAVELVDTESQLTLWTDEYDRPMADVFAVQTDVAERVASALNATLTPDERRRVEKPPTQDFAAYDLYLRSRSLAMMEREANREGIELLRRAVGMDPGFAVAHAELAYRLVSLASWAGKECLDLALQSGREAIQLDPALASGHFALASTCLRQGKVEDARVAFLRAMDLEPNDSGAMANLSVLDSELGHYDEALVWALRSFKLAPQPGVDSYYHVSLPLVLLNEDEAAEQWLNLAQERVRDGGRILLMRAILHARLGDLGAALDEARRLVAQSPKYEEARDLLAELAYAGSAPDAEASALRQFEQSPDLNADWWIFMHSPRLRYASLLMHRGAREKALALARKALDEADLALRDGNQSPRVPLEIAGAHALCGRPADALDALERAYAAGLRDHRSLAIDPVFEPLRGDPRFAALRARMTASIAVMRERANVRQTLAPAVPDSYARRPAASGNEGR